MLHTFNFDVIPKDFEKDIPLDSAFAEDIGFTSDKFIGYLHMEHNKMYYCAESINDNEENIINLFNNIEKAGLHIIIQNPSEKISNVCVKRCMMAIHDGENFEKFYSDPKMVSVYKEPEPFDRYANREPSCTCLHQIENNLPRTIRCFHPCDDQREILHRRYIAWRDERFNKTEIENTFLKKGTVIHFTEKEIREIYKNKNDEQK